MHRLLFNSETSVQGWTEIGDRVMGGISRSVLRYDASGFAVFEGLVSLENGGGFASVRHSTLHLGGIGVTGYRLKIRGDGKRYKLNLGTSQAFDAVQYQASFAPDAGVWVDLRIPVTDFVARFRGTTLNSRPPLDPSAVCQIGLMVADRQAGPFRLEICEISCEQAAQ